MGGVSREIWVLLETAGRMREVACPLGLMLGQW